MAASTGDGTGGSSTAAGGGDEASASADATATGASSSTAPYSSASTSPYGSMGSMGSMYGSPYGGMGSSMYGRSSMYGGGGYGGYGGGYGGMGGMYGGGMGGMYGGGMYGGMGMGTGSSYADSMFRMTQMLEMNSVMLDQMQEHVTTTYNRFRDVAGWIWALKDLVRPPPAQEGQPKEQQSFESEAAKQEAVQRVRRRVRVLLLLVGLFLALVFRDTRRQSRNLLADGAWLKAAEGLQLEPPPPPMPPQPQGMGPPMGPGSAMGMGLGGGNPYM